MKILLIVGGILLVGLLYVGVGWVGLLAAAVVVFAGLTTSGDDVL